jgi:hypothetical protein
MLFLTHSNLHLPKGKSLRIDGGSGGILYSFLGFDWGGLLPNDFCK